MYLYLSLTSIYSRSHLEKFIKMFYVAKDYKTTTDKQLTPQIIWEFTPYTQQQFSSVFTINFAYD